MLLDSFIHFFPKVARHADNCTLISTDMQNLSFLAVLDKPNEHLSSVWALMPPLSPKPGPSLPDLPKLLPGDNVKDAKGSRFAKFIAERHELLKKTTQSGKVESPYTKFIPSKL